MSDVMEYLTATNVAAAGGLCAVLLYTATAIYNAFINPLKAYPGPLLLRITRIPVTMATLTGQRAQFRFNLHRKYGPIVRVAPDELSYAHNQAWKDIYSTQSKVQPTRAIRGVEEDTGTDARSIVTAHGEVHTRQKRMITSIFTEKVIKEQEPVFAKYSDLLVAKLAETNGQPTSLADWYNFMTFDVIGELLFGESLGLLEHKTYIPWVRSIPSFLRGFASIVVLYEYRWFRVLWMMLPASFLRNIQATHFRYTSEKLDRYLKRMGARKEKKTADEEEQGLGIMARLFDGGSKQGMFLDELHQNAPILVFGGSETAATQSRCLTFLLLKNPDKMQRLTTEIRTAFPDSSEKMGYDSLLHLKYLHACVEEGLRVLTPCTNGLPRIVPRGGAIICGQYVPGGTNVSVAAHALHRSPLYWYQSDSFIPERWLEGEDADERFKNDDKGTHMPFSYGPHNCPGKKMGYFEVRLILAKVFWHFDLELLPYGGGELDHWDDGENYQTWTKKPLMVKAHHRKG